DRDPEPGACGASAGHRRPGRRHPAHHEGPHDGGHQPAGHRSVGRPHDPRGRRGVLLRRLRAVLRPRALRALHLHVRQRRRAPRAAARLHARRRRPPLPRPGHLQGRGGGRLGHQLRGGRLRASGERRPDRCDPERAGGGDRRGGSRGPARRHLARHRNLAHRGGLPHQHRVRGPRHRDDDAPGPARRQHRSTGPGLRPAPRAAARARAVGHGGHRGAGHRRGRVDAAQRDRMSYGAQRAHDRHHRPRGRRPHGAGRAALL
ncbi:MAG: Methionine aminopeptidase, partial [uncultured Nocardioides sp.]